MNIFKNLVLVLLLSLFSCNSANKTVSASSENDVKVETKNMIEAGFIKGTITISKEEGDCPITIKIERKEGAYYLDPINLPEDFKKDGEKVWFTFGGLRMMNRCDKASPVSIIEIQKQ